MADTETKQQFIELRAKGISYEKIANELSVSKQTLINWAKDFEVEISNYKVIEMDTLYEQYYISKQKRIEMLGQNLESLKEECAKRDLSVIPTEKLLDMILKYSSMLKEERVPAVFKEKQNTPVWDTDVVSSWSA